MKKLTLLTSILALAACGGGSGGSGVNAPRAVVTPDNPLLVDSDSGLGMIDVNKTRNATYEKALSTVAAIENKHNTDGSAQARTAALSRLSGMHRAPGAKVDYTDEDVNNAYQEMYDIFVDSELDGKTVHNVLSALAMMGLTESEIMDTLGGDETKSLDDRVKDFVSSLEATEKPDAVNDLIKKAKSIYDDFGSDFTLTLKDAKFYHNSNDTNYYTFNFDENGDIINLEELDGRKYAKDKNGVFENDVKTGNTVSFEHNGQANNHDFHVNVDVDYNLADYPSDTGKIRNDLITKISQEYGIPAAELKDVTQWINDADIINHGEECTKDSGCIVVSNFNRRERIRIETGSKELGLKYSDFGLRFEETDLYEGDSELADIDIGLKYYLYKEHGGFVGGYEGKKANPESGATYKGDSYVGLTRKLSDADIEEIMENGGDFPYPENQYYKGSAALTVNTKNESLNQKLVADFSGAGWYEVTVDNMPVNGHGGDFSFDAKGNKIDANWQVDPIGHAGKMENSNIKYYGPAENNATEAVGFVQYIEDKKSHDDWTFKADITFGAKKQ